MSSSVPPPPVLPPGSRSRAEIEAWYQAYRATLTAEIERQARFHRSAFRGLILGIVVFSIMWFFLRRC